MNINFILNIKINKIEYKLSMEHRPNWQYLKTYMILGHINTNKINTVNSLYNYKIANVFSCPFHCASHCTKYIRHIFKTLQPSRLKQLFKLNAELA